MEHKKECGPCEGGMAMLCGGGNCGGHYGLVLLRWFLGLVIILFVFCLGVKVGFYKGVIETGYGISEYGYGSRHGSMMSRNMMYFTQPVSSPEASATPKTK